MDDRQKNTCYDWHIPLVLVKKFKGVRATSFKTHNKVSENHRQWKNIMGQLMYMQIKRDIYLCNTTRKATFIVILMALKMYL